MFKNKNILISNGATRVYIDPIRYITNISSGAMGLSFAKVLLKENKVKLVSGNVSIKYPKNENLEVFYADTNYEMLKKLETFFNSSDIFISIAAAIDFDIKNFSNTKIKKDKNLDSYSIKLKQSIDILKTLSFQKKQNQIIIGFSLETENLLENAIKKMKEKKLDFIIANEAKHSMGLKNASAVLIDKKGNQTYFQNQPKINLAKNILEKISNSM